MMKRGCLGCQQLGRLCQAHARSWIRSCEGIILPAKYDILRLDPTLRQELWPSGKRCACGRAMSKDSTRCVRCFRVGPRDKYGHRLRPVVCRGCGLDFQPATSGRVYCSATCFATFVQLNAEPKSVRVRLQRRRACRIRRNRASCHRTAAVGRWRVVCERDGYVCWLCGEEIDLALRAPDKRSATADHVVPLARGGSDDLSNLRPAHFACNSRRGARIDCAVIAAAVPQ